MLFYIVLSVYALSIVGSYWTLIYVDTCLKKRDVDLGYALFALMYCFIPLVNIIIALMEFSSNSNKQQTIIFKARGK